MWMMCSPKLLTPEEWTGLSYWPSRAPIDAMDSLIQLCRGLVTWDRQLMVIKFPHLSVQEYLHSVFDSVDCNNMAAGCCLLMLNPVLPGSSGILIDYAITNWPYHVDHSYRRGRHIAQDLLDRLNNFLGTPHIARLACLDWLPIAIGKSVIEVKAEWIPYMMNISPLMIASYFRFGEELYHQWECDGLELSNEDSLPALLEVACGRGNEAVVKILLRNASMTAINWGNGSLREAIAGGYGGIAVQLVSSGVHHRNTDYQAILKMVAFEGDKAVMGAFMDSRPSFRITEEILIAAARRPRNDMIHFLLDTRFDVEITEEIMVAAAEGGLSRLEMLLDRSPAIQITEAIVIAVLAQMDCGKNEFLESLLARRDEVQITEAILICAVRTGDGYWTLLMSLLSRCPSIQITADLVIAVAETGGAFDGREWSQIFMKLLPLVIDSEISERIVVALGKASGLSEQVMTLLLTRCPGNMITEGIVLAVATYGVKVSMEALLAWNPDVEVCDLGLVEMLMNHS